MPSPISGFLRFVAVLLAVVSPMVYMLEQRLESFYIFEPGHLHRLSNRAIEAHGQDTAAIVDFIVAELKAEPRTAAHVNVDQEWIVNNAGGAMGAMYIIHASITEYLIIFGTAIGTEGHTGRHPADDYFNILTGEQWAYLPGTFEPEVYKAGSVHHLVRGTVKQYKMPEGCFALEYARGWIPPMLFFGFADGLSSTLDLPTMWRTFYVTGRLMFENLALGKF